MSKNLYFKQLCSVDELANHNSIAKNTIGIPKWIIVKGVQNTLNNFRHFIQKSDFDKLEKLDLSIDNLITESLKNIYKLTDFSLKHVINATGTVIHTNLGRSLLSPKVSKSISLISERYTNLEMSLDTGKRNIRGIGATKLLTLLTGAEDALIVNNNAAAVLLILSTFAKDKEVIVSRGEQVEVGGSFRIPDVMKTSGAKLIEVGATNKTHISDYEDSITDNTAALMKIHTSNFKIIGFTEEPTLSEIVDLAKKKNIISIHDLGSGSFIDWTKYNLPYEPLISDSMQSDVDILCFSGDKLLGGTQAGIILGKKVYIDKLRKNQLLRALRVDKLTLCGIIETLKLYLDKDNALNNIPTLKMLSMTYSEIVQRALKLRDFIINYNINIVTTLKDDWSNCGGGAMPNSKMPTKIISLCSPNLSTQELADKLREGENPIICRIHDDCIFLDTRTIFDDEFITIADKLLKICGEKK